MELVEKGSARARSPALDKLELKASGQLVGIIDVLLGLTLVEGALSFRGLFTQGSAANAPVVVAVVLVYYTAVRSFVDWHIAMEVRPYRILTDESRGSELVRVFLDFLIMASYSFLLLRAHVLIDKPDSNITAIATTYVALYSAYVAWGELRKDIKPAVKGDFPPFGRGLLLVACGAAVFLLLLYLLARAQGWLGETSLNTALLSLELLLMVGYRHSNWSQQVKLSDPAA